MDHSLLEIMSSAQPQVGLEDVRMTTEVHADIRDTEQILNQYKRGALIGKGQHGNVYLCYDLSQHGSKVAMKVVNRKNPRQDRLKELRRKKVPASGSHLPVTDNLSSTEHKIRKEIAIMKKCRHPHVVRLIEVIDDKLYKKVYMVMEYLGGGEVKWRDPSGRPVLRVEQCRRICRDVILGLEYLHHQGIIHRDIKPGNLLWTEDRRMVKIADFGVAHITAAHLAVDSHSRTPTSSDNLQLLFDDSELCKTAGTPAFLAPEVVIEFGRDVSASGSEAGSIHENSPEQEQLHASESESYAQVQGSGSTVQIATYSRPPITKAVDVWALGVTLYCLLFGELPFNPKQRNEFQLYKVICTEEWDVPETMGLDRLPTGGRHQRVDPSHPSEGALIVSLLERLLEKDASTRITLDEVKRHHWFLRDIPNVERWVHETVGVPRHDTPTQASVDLHRDPEATPEPLEPSGVMLVTQEEYNKAVSAVKFRWSNAVKQGIAKFVRRVRRPPPTSAEDRTGTHSEPSETMGRHRRPTSSPAEHRPRRRKPPPTTGDSTPSRRSSRLFSRSHAAGSSPSTSRTRSKERPVVLSPKPRPIHTATSFLNARERARSPTERSLSPSSSVGPDLDGGRRKSSGFSLGSSFGSLKHRLVGRPSVASYTSGPGPHEATTSTGGGSGGLFHSSRQNSSGQTSMSGGLRSSDEASPTSPVYRRDEFAPAVRASSWGDVVEYGRQAEDVTSLYSGAGDDGAAGMDDEAFLFGAGGIAHGPLPPTPNGGMLVPMQPVPFFGSLDAVAVAADAPAPAPATAVPQELMHSVPGRDPASEADPALQDATALSRATSRPHASSPLVQMSYSSEELDGEGDYSSDNSSSSFFARTSEDAQGPSRRCGEEEGEGRPSARELFGDDDDGEEDEDSSEEGGPIEVRRRRPSWSVHDPFPPESDSEEEGEGEGI